MNRLCRLSLLVLVLVAVPVGCSGNDSAPPGGARTYYESLDVANPTAAVETFVNAFARDDFMTVWLAFDMQAQMAAGDHMNLLRYCGLMRTDDSDEFRNSISQMLTFSNLETFDRWYLFDKLMLLAEENDAFLIDLRGKVTLGEVTTGVETTDVSTEVEGIDGPVVFRMSESATGRWQVKQVAVQGGDEEAVPWSAPDACH